MKYSAIFLLTISMFALTFSTAQNNLIRDFNDDPYKVDDNGRLPSGVPDMRDFMITEEGGDEGGNGDSGDESFFSTLAGYVAGFAIGINNAIVSGLTALGLTGVADFVNGVGMQFATNLAGPQGLGSTIAGTVVSVATGGVGGVVAGQVVSGTLNGTLGNDLGSIINSFGGLVQESGSSNFNSFNTSLGDTGFSSGQSFQLNNQDNSINSNFSSTNQNTSSNNTNSNTDFIVVATTTQNRKMSVEQVFNYRNNLNDISILNNNNSAQSNTSGILNTNTNNKIKVAGTNDVGVSDPKVYSTEDFVEPSIFQKVLSWAGISNSVSGGTKSGTPSTGIENIKVTNYCTADDIVNGSVDVRNYSKGWAISVNSFLRAKEGRPITIAINVPAGYSTKDLSLPPSFSLSVQQGISDNSYTHNLSVNPCFGSYERGEVQPMAFEGYSFQVVTTDDPRSNQNLHSKLVPGKINYLTIWGKKVSGTIAEGTWGAVVSYRNWSKDSGGNGSMTSVAKSPYEPGIPTDFSSPAVGVSVGTGGTVPPVNPGTPASPGSSFTARTVSNSSCSINLSSPQVGIVSTTLVYRTLEPVANGGYYTGGAGIYPFDSLAASYPECASSVADGVSANQAGNRNTFRNLNPVCVNKNTRTVYKTDYPDSCTTLCSSAHPSAFIDVRGDCVLNGDGVSF